VLSQESVDPARHGGLALLSAWPRKSKRNATRDLPAMRRKHEGEVDRELVKRVNVVNVGNLVMS
jgi:hypothetical protein